MIEFQFSPISRGEREKRESFYGKMAWVVCGSRLEKNIKTFNQLLNHAFLVSNAPIKLVTNYSTCQLTNEWTKSGSSVYFDFADHISFENRFDFSFSVIWKVTPGNKDEELFILPIRKDEFVSCAQTGLTINGIHDESLDLETPSSLDKREREDVTANRLVQDADETDIDYALRAWDLN